MIPIALSIPVGMMYKVFIHYRENTAREEFMEREQRDVAEMCKVEEEDYDKEFYSTFRPIADEGDEPLLFSSSPASAMRLQQRHDEQLQYEQQQLMRQAADTSRRPVFPFELEGRGNGNGQGQAGQSSRSGRLLPAANAAALQINTEGEGGPSAMAGAGGNPKSSGSGSGSSSRSGKNDQNYAANMV